MGAEAVRKRHQEFVKGLTAYVYRLAERRQTDGKAVGGIALLTEAHN
jgi:hypothetical protein